MFLGLLAHGSLPGKGKGMLKGQGNGSGEWNCSKGGGGKIMEKVEGPLFEHERLHVYRAARSAYHLVRTWLRRPMPRDLRDQLDRSIRSVMSNIAEGAGKTAKADKQRSYEFAKGSALEAAAQLEMLHVDRISDSTEYAEVRKLLLEAARMLHALAGRPRTT
jgi:four helix bundle protein